MDIRRVDNKGKADWNEFVREHYPPVGAFMQTWEWGQFQEHLGRRVERYVVTDGADTLGAFTLVYHALPMNFSYGYIPRGPVLTAEAATDGRAHETFRFVRDWIAEQRMPGMIFLRMEPPLGSFPLPDSRGFHAPAYYVQPRYNHAVELEGTEKDILKSFHPSTRSNMRRAENRGVTTELKRSVTEEDWDRFFAMAKETIQRNSGKNVYPQRAYFDAMVKAIPPAGDHHDPSVLSLGAFHAYEHGKPAAIHFVLFFGGTATYLYGASHSDTLRSKATTYLHWAAMREAKRRGLRYYDLGGVDETRWPTLTNFKRQFRGKEFSYVGNVDIPVRPVLYRAYNWVRKGRGVLGI